MAIIDPEDVKDELLELIDKATEPDKMSAEQAHETLQLLVVDLEFRSQALKDENKPDSNDWD